MPKHLGLFVVFNFNVIDKTVLVLHNCCTLYISIIDNTGNASLTYLWN